jgi:tRNA-dihydrouridine synthase
MLGRGLMGNPWLLTDYLGKPRPEPSEVLRRHADLLLEYYPEKKACSLLRKYVSKYTKGHPNAHTLRLFGNQISCAKDIDALLGLINV